MYIDLLIDVDNVVRFVIVRFVLCASSSFYVFPFGPSVYVVPFGPSVYVVPFGPSVYWIIHFD